MHRIGPKVMVKAILYYTVSCTRLITKFNLHIHTQTGMQLQNYVENEYCNEYRHDVFFTYKIGACLKIMICL